MLIKGIRGSTVKQSFASWLLWLCLDFIAFSGMFLESGNWHLAGIHVALGGVITLMFWHHGQYYWSWFETLVLTLAVICTIVWLMTDNNTAVLASTGALVAASLPQMRETWLRPNGCPKKIWFIFWCANLSSVIGGDQWSISERCYPVTCLALSSTMLSIIIVKQYRAKYITSTKEIP